MLYIHSMCSPLRLIWTWWGELSILFVILQLAKAAAQERNPAVTAAVLERLPYLAEVAAEGGDQRLMDLVAQGNGKGACSCNAWVRDYTLVYAQIITMSADRHHAISQESTWSWLPKP